MKMKRVACLAMSTLMAGAAIAAFAACTPDDGLDADGSVKKITMWVGGGEWTGQNYTNLENFIKDYNNAKPNGFTVTLAYKTDLETSFQSALTNGKQPDVMLWDRFNTATNSIKGYLYPVTELVERDNIDTSKFYAPAMQEMSYENQIYGLPVDVDVWGTYVNMKYVKEYDNAHDDKIAPLLKADWTWDDLLTVITKLATTSVNTAYSGGDQYEHLFKYYVSTGHGEDYLTHIVGDTTGRKYQTNFENQWTKDILNFFRQVKNVPNLGGRQESDSFINEECAMMNRPLYHNNEIKTSKVTDYKFLPQPRQNTDDGVNGGMVGGYGLAYPAPKEKYQNNAWKARHEAAWKFTQWLCYNKDSMLKWSKDIGSLPALNEALEADECVANNQVLTDARAYALAKKGDSFVYMIRPQVPNYLTLQTDVVNTYVNQFIGGTGDVDDCISKLKTNGNTKLLLGLN